MKKCQFLSLGMNNHYVKKSGDSVLLWDQEEKQFLQPMREAITAYIAVQRAARRGRAQEVHSREPDAKGGPSLSKIWILESELCELHLCQ